MNGMPNRPPLLRANATAPKPTVTALVAMNIRYNLGRERLGTSFFAQAAGISVTRARDVYYGRRPASISEVVALAKALGEPTASFLEGL